MHKLILDLLNKTERKDKLLDEINELQDSLDIAKKICSGEFGYCKKCNDYYLAKSFIHEQEIVSERVCTYSDPINSSGDEYEDKNIRYTYLICPKGHKGEINREEYWI